MLTGSAGIIGWSALRPACVDVRAAQRFKAAHAQVEAILPAGAAVINAAARTLHARPPCLRCLYGQTLDSVQSAIVCGSVRFMSKSNTARGPGHVQNVRRTRS